MKFTGIVKNPWDKTDLVFSNATAHGSLGLAVKTADSFLPTKNNGMVKGVDLMNLVS